MIRHILFNAAADRYQIADEAGQIRQWPGVRALRVLEQVDAAGQVGGAAAAPRYCLQVETEDAQDAALGARLQGLLEQYREHLSAVTTRTYRAIG